MDHYDASQYPSNAGDGTAYTDALAVDDTQLQYAASAEYAPLNEITDYIPPDVINANVPVPQAYTRPVKELPRYAIPRPCNGSGVILPGSSCITGINFRENAGTTATIVLYDGWDANGVPLMYINLAANESIRDYPPLDILAKRGLYAATTGTVQGIIYTREHL